MSGLPARFFSFGLLSLALAAAPALADVTAKIPEPPTPVNEPIPDDALTGRDIYKRVLDNRYDTFIQVSTLISV